MKSLLLPAILASVTFTATADAAIVYSGVRNIAIPQTLEGAYLRISDGATSGAFPADWSTAPWLNPFFGGVDIANSPQLRPIITGTSQIVNLAPGTLINSASNFVAGESGSSTHVGPGAGQFTLGTPGIIGLSFNSAVGNPDLYGWIRIAISNSGSGQIVDWAFQSTPGTAIQAGQIAVVPEPGWDSRTLLLAMVGSSLLFRRRCAVSENT